MDRDSNTEKRIYTETDKRKALSAAYCMLNTKGNHNRYSMTRFGVSMDHSDPDEGLYFSDVLNCLAIMHNEMADKQKREEAEAKNGTSENAPARAEGEDGNG